MSKTKVIAFANNKGGSGSLSNNEEFKAFL